MFFLFLILLLAFVYTLTYKSIPHVLPVARISMARRMLLVADVLSVVLLLAGNFLHLFSSNVARVGVILVSILWMTQLLVSIPVMLLRLLRKWTGSSATIDQERRGFLSKMLAFPVLAICASLYASLVERKTTVVRHHDIPIADLPPSLQGFRIAQLSDIHLGLFCTLEELTELLTQTATTGADALVITGDLFDHDDMNSSAAQILQRFTHRFPKGIWFCYGNHEYFRKIYETQKALANTDVHVLVNTHACVLDGDMPLYFAGVDYPMHRSRFEALQKEYTADAFRGIPSHAVTVLLAHHPDFIDTAALYRANIVLTGHTHGGQIGCLGIPLVPPVFKYMRGMYKVGETLGYVHTGNGSWFPYRLGCPPEIAVFRLVAAKA